jgi:hypothetical protein
MSTSTEKVAAVAQSLACNSLPFRGHTDNFALHHSANFIMALKHIAEFSSTLAELQKNGNPGRGHTSYLSTFTYEHFIILIANKVNK